MSQSEGADPTSSEPGSTGRLTRAELLKRAAVGAGALSVPGLLGSLGSGDALAAAATAAAKPRRGGNLRVGLAGGGAADTLDAHFVRSNADNIRLNSLYDALMQVDHNFKLTHRLAEEVSSNKAATEWTVRLRDHVEFHNGKTLDADDVIFSIKRITNPKNPGTGGGQLRAISRMKKLDKRTVRITCNRPFSVLDNALGDGGTNNIVPVGYNPKKPVGTGPFMYESFTPGQRSVFKRNPNYWDGNAYLETLTLIDLTDDSARVNALLAGQVDAISAVPANQIAVVRGNNKLKLLISPTGAFSPIYMRCDKPPFSDNRVRQAMRLIINRKQAVEHALGGYGQVGNDLVSRYDPAWAANLHREQDLDQAKSLLKKAGREDLSVVLNTSPVLPSTVPGTEVLAQNASQIGVKIKLRQIDPGTLYGTQFLTWNFAVDWYPALSYIDESSLLSAGKYASTNLQHFDNPTYNKLFFKALSTVDPKKRNELIREMEKIDFDQGGMIIYAYIDSVDAYSAKVGGFTTDKTGIGLGRGTFHKVHFV